MAQRVGYGARHAAIDNGGADVHEVREREDGVGQIRRTILEPFGPGRTKVGPARVAAPNSAGVVAMAGVQAVVQIGVVVVEEPNVYGPP